MIDPHLAHWAGGGSVDRRLNTSSILEWRLWDISLSYSPGQNGNDQYCSILCTEGLVLAPLFSRGRTSAKMPVQPTLLHLSCAPPDRFEQRTAFARCHAKCQRRRPRRAGIWRGGVNPKRAYPVGSFSEQLRSLALRSVGQLRESRFQSFGETCRTAARNQQEGS
jgi:hypothetical protein